MALLLSALGTELESLDKLPKIKIAPAPCRTMTSKRGSKGFATE
jgi:hypothetical protein